MVTINGSRALPIDIAYHRQRFLSVFFSCRDFIKSIVKKENLKRVSWSVAGELKSWKCLQMLNVCLFFVAKCTQWIMLP